MAEIDTKIVMEYCPMYLEEYGMKLVLTILADIETIAVYYIPTMA